MINRFQYYRYFIQNTRFYHVKKKNFKDFVENTSCQFLIIGNYDYSTYLSKLIKENSHRFISLEKTSQNNIPVGIYTVTPTQNKYYKMS